MENKLSSITNPEGHLLSLPRELRDDIFVPLLRAGSVAILRTSKQIHDEAKEHLIHEATFRVKMGFTGGRVNSFPTNWKDFERFHFRIFLGTPNTLPQQPTFRLFDRFTDLDGTNLKRECFVSIEYGDNFADSGFGRPGHNFADWGFGRPGHPTSLCEKLACLNTFTTVVVEFVRHCEVWSAGLQEKITTLYMRDMMADKWQLWEKKLKPGLGTGRLESQDHEGAQLVFHPLEYHSSLARKGAGISEKD